MLEGKIQKPISIFLGFLIIVMIVTYFTGLYNGTQKIGFTVLFPTLFLLAIANDIRTFYIKKTEILIYLLFVLLCLASVYYSDFDFQRFEMVYPKIIAAFMGGYIALSFTKNKSYEDYFHLAYILASLMLFYSEYRTGTFGLSGFYKQSGSRAVFTYNANYYSYFSFFANFSIFRLHLKYKNLYTGLGLIIIPVISILMSFVTQSRSGLIFVLTANILFWIWINKIKFINPLKQLFAKSIMIITGILVLFQFSRIYFQSSIQSRISSNISEDGRTYLMKEALNVFFEYPFLGVGTGNFVKYNPYHLFSHNSYTEALAEQGILIGGLIIVLFFLPFIKSTKLLLRNKADSNVKLAWLFFALFMLLNNVYVFYEASYAMLYFFVYVGFLYHIESKISGSPKLI
ncbi:O-antigen ligase family protein [Robiginitalea aurantiaca]|uniref:O-antigen ligase family protein n=1 Tax=Robiginitalea aurantiaca TaxID=3056915 RepID=A0ABT7WJ01_9FLAO|nr:O-antigen ligase family protein [Robiginitalea aurantiaca]MDM9632799.1 O-antigen ligase family protein [Robiginitalea aurantiaca]